MCLFAPCRWFYCCKQMSAYELRISDWSADVCSSDLQRVAVGIDLPHQFGFALMTELGPAESGANDAVDRLVILRIGGTDDKPVRQARCPERLPVSCRRCGIPHRHDASRP